MSNYKGTIYFLIVILFVVFMINIYNNYSTKTKDLDEKNIINDSIYSFQIYTLSDSNLLKIIDCSSQYLELTKYFKDKDEKSKDLFFNEELDHKSGHVYFWEENGKYYVTIEILKINYNNYYEYSDHKIFIYNNYQFYVDVTSDTHSFFKKTDTVIYKKGLIPEEEFVMIYDPYFWQYSYDKNFQIEFIFLEFPEYWDTICKKNNVPYNVVKSY